MERIGIINIFFIYLLLSGCPPQTMLEFHEEGADEYTERFEPSPGLGNLYIVKKLSLVSSKADVYIKVNGQYIGKIQQSTYHLLELPPGTYSISTSLGKHQANTEVRVAADKNHFIQVDRGVGVKQIDAEKGREMVSLAFRLATLPVEFKRQLTREDVLEMPAADLAEGYLAASASVALVKKHVDAGAFGGSGARFVLGIRGESVDKDNVNEYLAKSQKELSLYEGAINQRGFVKIAGAYKGEATESCSRSNSIFAAILQEQKQVAIEIRQKEMNALIVISVSHEGGEVDVSNPAAVVESAIAVNEAANSDYFFRGEVNNSMIVIRPEVSVLKTWPKWANPPTRKDLEDCIITLKKYKGT